MSIGFKCSELPNVDTTSQSDPFIVFYKQINGQWSKIGNTEIIYDDLNPEFVKKIQVDHIFEMQEYYKVEVYDADDANAIQDLGSQDFIG